MLVDVCWPKATIANIVLLTFEWVHWEMVLVRGEVCAGEGAMYKQGFCDRQAWT